MANSVQQVRDYVADQYFEEAKREPNTSKAAQLRGDEYNARHGHRHPSDPKHPSRQGPR
jgi:hypothetical protein